LCGYATTVGFHEFFYNGETHSDASGFAGAGLVGAVEAFKNVG
jgi:hypothetical protein